MRSKPLTISIVAKQAGVGVETIRYYQRIGLIEEPVKPASGYRVYPAGTVARLHFIQRAKELGFTLAEIADLLEIGEGKCDETRRIAAHKLELITAKIKDLESMADVLRKLIQSCEANHLHQGCPIISTLSKD